MRRTAASLIRALHQSGICNYMYINIYISITNLSCLDIFVIDIDIYYKFVLSVCLSVSHQLRVCEPKS